MSSRYPFRSTILLTALAASLALLTPAAVQAQTAAPPTGQHAALSDPSKAGNTSDNKVEPKPAPESSAPAPASTRVNSAASRRINRMRRLVRERPAVGGALRIRSTHDAYSATDV